MNNATTVFEFVRACDLLGVDIDIYDDYDERLAIAYCGDDMREMTAAGLDHFKRALSLTVTVDCGVATVHCDTSKDAAAAKEFFYSAAGYCSERLYKEWFMDLIDLAADPDFV